MIPARVLFAAGCMASCLAGQQSEKPAYDQPYRPQFHFSPRLNWTNDPNGLVYFGGEYHLFFQYNPFGDLWGHMSWGHAVSRDLLHWQELPVALPEENGIMIFTGSTVVDDHNTSGFCQGKKGCMVAIYTGHTPESPSHPALQTQNIAYSNDRGRTWTKYRANPVLNLNLPDFRDPKVFWSKQGRRWIMVVSLPNEHKVRFYGSPDLKQWNQLSDFGPEGATGGQWECPELFELPVHGDEAGSRWVLKVGLNPGALQGGSGEQYFVGQFDGTRFTNENPPATTLWTDYGKDCYCALTFNHLPPAQQAVMIGWMDNWQYAAKLPTSPWRGQMTLPRMLSLHKTALGIRLFQRPLPALESLYEHDASGASQPGEKLPSFQTSKHSFRILSSIPVGTAKQVGWNILAVDGSGTTIGYDVDNRELFFDRKKSGVVDFSPDFPARMTAPLTLAGGVLRLDLIVDRNSVEVFADGGRVTMTNLVFPLENANQAEMFSTGGTTGATNAQLWELGSSMK